VAVSVVPVGAGFGAETGFVAIGTTVPVLVSSGWAPCPVAPPPPWPPGPAGAGLVFVSVGAGVGVGGFGLGVGVGVGVGVASGVGVVVAPGPGVPPATGRVGGATIALAGLAVPGLPLGCGVAPARPAFLSRWAASPVIGLGVAFAGRLNVCGNGRSDSGLSGPPSKLTATNPAYVRLTAPTA
jgi:hypothetical protein